MSEPKRALVAVAPANSPTRSLFNRHEPGQENNKYELTEKPSHDRHNDRIGAADLLVKMAMVGSSVATFSSEGQWRGREVVDDYSYVITRVVSGDVYNGGAVEFSAEDVASVRAMVAACHAVLRHAVNTPAEAVSGVKGSYKFNLNIGMVDLLRTARFLGGYDESAREYTKACRSYESQVRSVSCQTMRHCKDTWKQMYATGDQMAANFEEGLQVLHDVSRKPDDDIAALLRSSWRDVSAAAVSFLFPSVFDGRRMKAANCIAARFYGTQGSEFGSVKLLSEIFDSSASVKALLRLVKTTLAILAMARQNVAQNYAYVGSVSGKSKRQCLAEAKTSDEWKRISDVLEPFMGHVSEHLPLSNNSAEKNSPPNANKILFETLSEWFENAIRDERVLAVLSGAFQFKGVVAGSMSRPMHDAWTRYSQEPRHSVWEVAHFLLASRMQMHNGERAGSNIFVCALVCLSGAVGGMLNSKAEGPFVFDEHVVEETEMLFAACTSNSKLKNCVVTGKQKAREPWNGKKCRATNITRNIYNSGYVRKQHDKSVLMDTRLSVCFFMLSLTEEIRKDLLLEGPPPPKPLVSPLVYEGRKDGRRLYVISLQAMPFSNYSHFRGSAASHLIEKSRKNPGSVRTTADNTEKPFRDVVGGALINTLLYPLAGSAFFMSISQMVDEHRKQGKTNPNNPNDPAWFESKTNECVNLFVRFMRSEAYKIFDTSALVELDPSGPVHVGADDARKMMLQQLAFVNKFCDVVEDSGSLWEDLQLSFSVQPPSMEDIADVEDSSQEEDEEEGSAAVDRDGLPSFGGGAKSASEEMALVSDDDFE